MFPQALKTVGMQFERASVRVNTWLWNFGSGKPRLGGLTASVEETAMRKKTVRKDQAKRSAEARRGRRADGA